MEQTMVHIAETAAWLFVVMIIFAIIGVIATIHWIVRMVTSGERAVESGVQNVEGKFTRHDQ
jgi:F0F1-type ATP synthase assembly protein I